MNIWISEARQPLEPRRPLPLGADKPSRAPFDSEALANQIRAPVTVTELTTGPDLSAPTLPAGFYHSEVFNVVM